MWLKSLPLELLEELLPESDLLRSRQMHGLIPRDRAISCRWAAGGGGRPVRLALAIALPDAVGAVRMTRRAVRHAQPEHTSRPFRLDRIVEHLVGGFAVDDGHGRMIRVRFAHGLDRR